MFTRILMDGCSPCLFVSHFQSYFEIEGVVVSQNSDPRIWTLLWMVKSHVQRLILLLGGSVFHQLGKEYFGGLYPSFDFHSRLACFTGKLSTDAFLCARGFIFSFPLSTMFYFGGELWHLFLECLFVWDLWNGVSSAFEHCLYLDGSVLDLCRETMRILFST